MKPSLVLWGCVALAAFGTAADMRLTECEGQICGGDWKISGLQGSAHWPNGSVGSLTVERFDHDQVIIHRQDSGGTSAGITAVYSGKLHDDRVDGKVTYTWPGHWNAPKTVAWGATLDHRPKLPSLPSADSGSLPDLNGVWRVALPNRGWIPNVGFAVVQIGTSVTTLRTQPGDPYFSFRGTFTSRTSLIGHPCGPAIHPENPDCVPQTVTVKIADASNMTDSSNDRMQKIAGTQDRRFLVGLKLVRASESYVPTAPFDLSGTWQLGEQPGAPVFVSIAQRDSVVTMAYASGGFPFFAGRYIQNPVFPGTGRGNAGLRPWSLHVDDPDHIRIVDDRAGLHVFFRRSPPHAHDLPCDLRDQFHVSRFYAWMRGSVAWSAHDLAAARCWLTLSAHQGFPRGQAVLAAFMIRAPDGIAPDYATAFQLAAKSARAGDVPGQLVLASMFREGKGTLADPVKARYWEGQANRSRELDLWRRLSAKNMFGMSVIDMAVAVTDAVSQGVQMADPSGEYHCRKQVSILERCHSDLLSSEARKVIPMS